MLQACYFSFPSFIEKVSLYVLRKRMRTAIENFEVKVWLIETNRGSGTETDKFDYIADEKCARVKIIP